MESEPKPEVEGDQPMAQETDKNEQEKGLDDSLALAQKMQEEEDSQMAQEAENKEGEQMVEEPKGEPISSYVKQDLVKQIMEMGYSKDVSEKALFMNLQNQSVESAVGWIGDHMEDPDFNEPLLIVKKEGDGDIKKPYQGNMTKEERIALAEAKIAYNRKIREEEEKKTKLDQERSRGIMAKEIAAAQRLDKERQQKLDIEERIREKKQLEKEKFAMKIQLERDRCERMGVPFDEEKALNQIKQKEQKPPFEEVKHGIKTVKTLYTEDRQPGVAKTCLKTINIYATNVMKDPTNEKFLSINLANEAFQKRVGKINGGKMILKGLGFVENTEEQKLTLGKYDEELFKKSTELLQLELR